MSGNILTIECQDETSTDTVYFEVRGERRDKHMLETEWTDENGKVITEPLKQIEAKVHKVYHVPRWLLLAMMAPHGCPIFH